jgi:hypothetical protein
VPSYDVPDLWQLSWDEPDWLRPVILRLLSVGVPPTAISKAFELEVDAVKDLQRSVRIHHFGTAELGEAIHNLMWKAYEDTLELIRHSPPSQRLRLNMALLARGSTLVGGQTPEGLQKMQEELTTMMAEARGTEAEVTSSIYETVPVDAPPDDPEERLTG